MRSRLCLALAFILTGSFNSVASSNDKNDKVEVEFLSAEKARNVLSDTEYDDFFGKMHHREISAMTGQAVADKDLKSARDFARKYFQEQVAEFQDDEREALEWLAREISNVFSERYNFVAKTPWRFIRVNPRLCSGFSFTRYEAIIIGSPLKPLVQTYKRNRKQVLGRFGPLLVHEKMHVLQRVHAEKFVPLYEGVLGYKRAMVSIHPWIDQRQIGNPDGQDENWVMPLETPAGTLDFWLGTMLVGDREVYRMGHDFQNVAVQMMPAGDASDAKQDAKRRMAVDEAGKPIYRPLTEYPSVMKRLPVRGGHEHPNELSANMMAEEFGRLLKGEAAQATELWVGFRAWADKFEPAPAKGE